MTSQNKRHIGILLTIVFLLLIPLIAMQFLDTLRWSKFDFAVAGCLLLATGVLCELVIRKVKNWVYRLLICQAIFIVLFLIWAEIAVGVFGTRFVGS
jgi:hypothetical protein